MTDAIAGLHAVTVHVRDLARARAFYSTVLGLRELPRQPPDTRLVFAIPGSPTLLTMHIQAPGEEGREPGTVSGLVFHHPDPKAAAETIRQRGGTIVLEPVHVEVGGSKFFRMVFADPDGNEFLLSDRSD